MAEEETKAVEEESSGPVESDNAGRGLRYKESKAVCRRCRRMGEKLYLKGEKCFTQKCPFVRKKYAPGQHGQKPVRLSDYGFQLQAKQKVCEAYKLTDQQLRNIVEEASETPISTQEKIATLLESRLDSTLYQGGLALSRRHGRQLVSHGKVKVNGKKVSSPSYKIKKGDKIEVNKKIINGNLTDSFKRIQSEKQTPAWFKLTGDNVIEVDEMPGEEVVRSSGFNLQAIIEFYSR